jgi:hypothetical protein
VIVSSFRRAGNFTALLVFALLSSFSEVPFSLPLAWGKDSEWQTIQSSVENRKYVNAEKQISQYIRSHPGKKEAYLLGGRIARRIHRPDSGLSIVDKGLRRYPSDPTLLRLKAELLMEQGDMAPAKRILTRLSSKKNLPTSEKKKIREDLKTLNLLALSLPPLVTFDQNINFQEMIPPPFQSPDTYIMENSSYHLRVNTLYIAYSGAASIGIGVAIESPLIGDTLHFQVGTNEYIGTVAGEGSSVEGYLYGGVDGQGPHGIQFLADAGEVFSGNQIDSGFYGHVDLPAGSLRLDAQGWYQLPWSGYGEAIVAAGLQSGALMDATWSFTPKISLSGEYEYTYDTLQGNRLPFGINHNALITFDWEFLKTPDLHFITGYDTQAFAPSVANSTLQVPVLLSSNFAFAGFSSLDQIGHYVVLNGQLGGVVGTFDTPGLLAGYQGDGGISFQITPHFELYANLSYESLAESYIGAVTTMMSGINIWF